jgi:[ribosomal protein S5]-alanine N-acetyltransferase
MNNAYAAGALVYLRHPTRADAEGPWHEWLSDEETTRWLSQRYWPNSVERQVEFYESTRRGEDRLVLSIVDVGTEKHIGVCNLSSISWVHRYCDLAIVIGDKAFRKGPHMLEAVSLMLNTAFLRLNMRIVKSSFAASNDASKTIHDVFRFKEVGRLEGLLWDRGRYVDNVIAMLRREDWMRRNGIASNAEDSVGN